jgi:hypothetical protein
MLGNHISNLIMISLFVFVYRVVFVSNSCAWILFPDLCCCFPQVNSAWETLNRSWKERVDRLDEAMQAAVQFQDGLQVHYCSLWIICSALSYIRTCSVGHTIFVLIGQDQIKCYLTIPYRLNMALLSLNTQANTEQLVVSM